MVMVGVVVITITITISITIYVCGYNAILNASVTVVHTGSAAEACHSHAASLLHHRMFVFGGTQGYHQSCPALRVLDLKTHTWEKVGLPQAAPQACPLPCFSHSLTTVGGLLVLAGGCHTLGAG